MHISNKLFVSILAGVPLFAGPVSNDLKNLPSTATTDVLVQFAKSPTTTMIDKIKANGGAVKRKSVKFPTVLYSLSTASINALTANGDVKFASKNRKLKGTLDYANPAVNAPAAFDAGFTGSGIGIAVIDSGVKADHPDLLGRVVYSQNFVPNETTTSDLLGHGTHVSVIAAGNAAASTGVKITETFRGIAPGAKIVNLRVLDSTGAGSDAEVIAAIDRAIELKSTYNIRVINLSLGRPVYESFTLDPLCQAVESAWKSGIVVVVAAGNGGRNLSMGTNGYSTISSPGNDPWVITVGATKDVKTETRADDVVTTYSSKGPTLVDHIAKPDLVAPGNLIVAAKVAGATTIASYPENEVPLAYYTTTGSGKISSDYFTLSGTSMATPMVSGAAALMLQKTPTLTPDLVKARMMRTASKSFPASYTYTDPATGVSYTVQHDLFTIGAGYLDANAALNDTSTGAGSALSPRAAYDAATGSVSLVYNYLSGTNIIWGTNIVWGTNIIWGTNIVWGTNTVVEGTNIVWGDSATSGFNIVWGDNIVWCDSSAPTLFDLALSARGDK